MLDSVIPSTTNNIRPIKVPTPPFCCDASFQDNPLPRKETPSSVLVSEDKLRASIVKSAKKTLFPPDNDKNSPGYVSLQRILDPQSYILNQCASNCNNFIQEVNKTILRICCIDVKDLEMD